MEVFMRNLPSYLTEDGLRDELKPVLNQLGIIHYLCEKPRRKQFGYITFLKKRDGERFLAVHGQRIPFAGSRRPTPQLRLIGSDIYCAQSINQPKDITLSALQHASDQRKDQLCVIESSNSAVMFQTQSLSCGYYTFVGSYLTYRAEVRWPDRGIMKFKRQAIIVKLDSMILMRIPLATVVDLVWSVSGSLTMTLSSTPLLFSCDENSDGNRRTRLCALSQDHAKVIGQCLVYQFKVLPIGLPEKIQQLKKLEIPIAGYDLRAGGPGLGNFATDLKVFRAMLVDYTAGKDLPFEILFQLQALADNAYLHPRTVLNLAKELCSIFREDRLAGKKPISVDAMKKLFAIIDWPYPDSDPEQFEVGSLLAAIKANEQEIRDGLAYREGLTIPGRNLARINRVIVTPTRIILHGPEMEPSNRILRKFPNHHNCFIRAQFCDENGDIIYFGQHVQYEHVFSRFKHIMKLGIQIAGRTYKFLGFSNSSLRSHSVWFCCPFVDQNGHFQTHFSIIKAIGNFSHIASPARCAARIGQAFSETPFTIPLRENGIRVLNISDVKSPDGSRIFSDGVGVVSKRTVASIRSSIPSRKGKPTCFQVRYGGSKGMLALDSRLPGSFIQVRPSMTKFESEDTEDLEICDMASAPTPLVLNRQLVKILEDMGVSNSWFIKLQADQLENIRGVTENAITVARFLSHHSIGDCIALHQLFRQCHLLQLDYSREPFLRSVVEVITLRELRLLKHKARIPVRKGITLFGIMDETGLLKEGEVYVTFDTTGSGSLSSYTSPPSSGPVIVTRSPALHDGDIQIAKNVIPPKQHPLRDHRNCIVFSKKGTRDLPSQLSGGDLDGDLYNVIWDSEAKPVRTFAPADYPRVDPVNIGRAIEVEDMANFFVDFMKSDHLGIIATRHMILADRMKMGTSDPSCKKLAELHSAAVDFSKTGIAVKVEELPRTDGYRPDFMAPGPHQHIHDKSDITLDMYVIQEAYDEDNGSVPRPKYYRSEKILGKLYRAIDERKIWNENVRLSRMPNSKAFWDEFLLSATARCQAIASVKWMFQREQAERIRAAYDDAIISVMSAFSEHPMHPITELEVFTGHLINKAGAQTHRQRGRSIKLKDEFERIASWITGLMRRDVSRPLTGYEQEFDSLELCLACLHVGGQETHNGNQHRRTDLYGRLVSFRVVAACALLAELDYYEKKLTADGFIGKLPDVQGPMSGMEQLMTAIGSMRV